MLNNIITTILMREGKISLPTIGIIVKVDFDGDTTYLFTPSTAKADSNILAMIRSEMEVSNEEAINILDSYVDFVKNIITKNGKYHLRGVGDILRNDSNVFYFMPIAVEPTVKEKEIEMVIEEVRNEIIEDEVVVEEVEESKIEVVVKPEPIPEKVEEPIKKVLCEVLEHEETARFNERFQPKRLGEIIEGGSTKRFYDKVHSQVVSTSEETKPEISLPVMEAPKKIEEISLPIEQPVEQPIEQPIEIKVEVRETVIEQPKPVVEEEVIVEVKSEVKPEVKPEPVATPKRRGLYDIYEKGVRKDFNPLEFKEVRRDPVATVAQPSVDPVVEPQPQQQAQPQPQQVAKLAEPVQEEKVATPAVEAQLSAAPKKKHDVVLILSIIIIVLGLLFIIYSYMMKKDLGI